MAIKWRQRLPAGHQLIHARDALKEGNQGWLAFEHESPAAPCRRRNQPDEIHRIAQSTLGVEEHRLSGRVRSVPLRLGEPAIKPHVLKPQTPFKFLPTFGQSSKLQQNPVQLQ